MALEAQLEGALARAAEPDSPNRLKVGAVRRWLQNHLDARAEELPEEPENRWDLLSGGTDPERLMIIVGAYIGDDRVDLAVGRGEQTAFRAICGHEFADEPAAFLAELERRLGTLERIEATRAELDAWLADAG